MLNGNWAIAIAESSYPFLDVSLKHYLPMVLNFPEIYRECLIIYFEGGIDGCKKNHHSLINNTVEAFNLLNHTEMFLLCYILVLIIIINCFVCYC